MIRYRCGDDRVEVLIRAGRDGVQVTVGGEAFVLDVHEVAPGTYAWRRDGRHELFHCVADGDVVHLAWRGVTYRLEREDEARPTAPRHVASGLESPMPGKVIKVHVRPGDSVTRGQEVLVVEAMKMENAIRAPRDGTVQSVSVVVGDMVNPGVVLVALE